METSDSESQHDTPAWWENWMNDDEEIRYRYFVENQDPFKEAYPELFAVLEELKGQVLLEDPTWLVASIDEFIGYLPNLIEEAGRGIDSHKMAKLTHIQKAIKEILMMGWRTPVHDSVISHINKKERLLNDYLLHLMKLDQEVGHSSQIQNDKGVSQKPTPPASDDRQNAFNDMPLDEVRQWFTQLAETNSKNGSPFLTVEQVGQFIDWAFCEESFSGKLSINEQRGDKANVIGLFHLFYTDCVKHRPGKGKIDPSATTEKYIKLLTDHFDNWTYEQVRDNFRAGGNWKNKP